MSKNSLLFIGLAVAIIATIGSLFLSEVMYFIPCELCWFQRIMMYPLTLILGLAYLKRDYKQAYYVCILSILGGLIALLHYLIQMLPFESKTSCGIVPCTVDYLNWFGFITIPFLALIAFLIISITSFTVWKRVREHSCNELTHSLKKE
ncbi:disulfide oxidoreductase [Brevibacillus sp. NRS-1366]|uniref:disulfide oxidoreductase n=1 Tax=Brevibacillus sp. NRS-1366 TaxID=3233899 RepID=UPI003D260A92